MKKILGFATFIVVMLLFVVNNTVTISSYMEEDGFVMPESKIDEYMKESSYNQADDFDAVEISEFDFIYEKSGNYYTEDNVQIDLYYPAIIRDGNAMTFINGGAYVISNDFDYAPTVAGTIIADQTCFNMDGGVVDEETYIVAQLRNGLFVTTTEFSISTQLEDFEISKNAIVYFSSDFINVYNYNDDGGYEYLAIRGLQYATITYNGEEALYSDFYEGLYQVVELVIQEMEAEEEKEEEIQKEIEVVELPVDNTTVPEPVDPPENPPEIEENEKTETSPEVFEESEEEEPVEIPYTKPEVEITDVSAWVYSINGQIEIYDPSGRINGSITFYVYDESGSLILREQTKQSGLFSLTTVPPDSVLVVEAYFEYYNKYNIKVSEQCLEATVVQTYTFENNIAAVSLSYDEDTLLYSESMGMKNLTLENTTDYNPDDDSLSNFYKNVLPYVYTMSIVFEDLETGEIIESKVSSSVMSKLRSGESVDCITSTDLEPDTTYSYYFVATDRYGNEFELIPNELGEYTTCKEAPKVDIEVITRETDIITFELELEDEYDAIVGDTYTVVIMYGEEELELEYTLEDISGTSVEIDVSTSFVSAELSVTNLPYSVTLQVYAYGTYNINDGNGDAEDQLIGYLSFYSAGIPTGTITFNNSFYNIGGTTVSIELSIAQNSTAALVELITDTTMYFETDGQECEYTLSNTLFNSVNIDENYNEELGALLIQVGNEKTSIPEIWLYADKTTLETNGVWQTFVNSGLYGKTSSDAGYVTVELMQGTLLSSSMYEFDMTSVADLGSKSFDVTTYVLDQDFSTLKQEPVIYYEDYFIASDFIEIYDLEILDPDSVIIDNVYSVQLYQGGQLVDTITLDSSVITETVRFDSLAAGNEYTISFVAAQYNLTVDDDLLEYYHVMKEFSFDHDEGLQALIELTSMTYNYDSLSSLSSNSYGYVGANSSIGYGHNMTSNEVEEMEGYFITDYLEYNCNSEWYSVFKDFVDYGEVIYFSFYNADYTFIGDTSTTTYSTLKGFSEYVNSSQFKYTTAKYVRVTGSLENIDEAYYYQYQEDDLEVMVDISVDPSVFELDVQIGATVADYTSATYSSTGYVEVTAGELLEIKQSSDYVRLYFYDEAMNYIQSKSIYYNYSGTVQVPSTACYVRVMIQTAILESETGVCQIARLSGGDDLTALATVSWQVEDTRDDAFFLLNDYNENTEYTITKYVMDISATQSFSDDNITYERVETITYDGSGNIDVSKSSIEILDSGMSYKYEISIEYHGRKVVLDEVTFDTNGMIYFISDIRDFYEIEYDRYGDYYVTCDIVEEGTSIPYNIYLAGTVDFQGYSLTLTTELAYSSGLFEAVYEGGEIKNIEVIVGNSENSRPLVDNNYGTISNIKYTIDKDLDYPVLAPLVYTNQYSGVIENFIIEFNGDTLFYNESDTRDAGIFVTNNYGTISNGYIYNTEEDAAVYLYGRTAILTFNCYVSGSINNVYAVCDIYSNYSQQSSSDDWHSAVISVNGDGRITNIFGISTRYEFFYDSATQTITNELYMNAEEPLFTSLCAVDSFDDSFENVYLASEYESYLVLYSTYFDTSSLHDVDWYDVSLGQDSNFIVSDMVLQGYYPILDLDDSMDGKQVYIELPELETVVRPDYLYYTVIDETKEYVDIELVFNNTSKATISSVFMQDVSAMVIDQTGREDLYIVTVRLSDATEYINEYVFSSFAYRTTVGTSTVVVGDVIGVSFYYPISTIYDFKTIEENLTWNFRLMSDISFSNWDDLGLNWNTDIYVGGTYYGIFDGGRYDVYGVQIGNYTISDVDLTQTDFAGDGLFFYGIKYGEMKNVNFENITWEKQTDNYAGIIYRTYQSTLDNVHLSDIDFTACHIVGSLVAVSYGSTIQNCSSSDIMLTNGTTVSTGFRVGGLLGYASYTNITNSFVQDFHIETHDLDLSTSMAVGGIVGEAASSLGYITDCYAVGRIENPSYNGGILGIGTCRIENCYSDVLIVADGDFNGGIYGSSSTAYVSDCLAVGDIVIMQDDPTYTHRISAVSNWYYTVNNYAYVGQTINSENIGLDDADAILSYSDLTNSTTYLDTIMMGTEYDYGDVDNGILPKLYDTSGELLDNQVDNYLDSGDLEVVINDTGYVEGKYQAEIRVVHDGYEVDSVVIEGMSLTEPATSLDTGYDNISLFVLRADKTMAVDLYLLTVTLVSTDGSGTVVELITTIDYGETVYWEIEDIYDWQIVMAEHGTTNENILITGTVDFGTTGITPLDDLSLNRLDGETDMNGNSTGSAVLKNISLTDSTGDNLISSVYASVSNLTIESSSIVSTSTTAQSTVGFFGVVQGEATNLSFKNNSITLTSAGSYIGMIAKSYGLISYCTIEDITITVDNIDTFKNNHLGGLVGYTTSGIQHVEASGVTINAMNGGYIGGVAGYVYKSDTSLVDLSDIHVDDIIINASYNVGGVVGYSYNISNLRLTASNVTITEYYDIAYVITNSGYRMGGISGYSNKTLDNSDVEGFTVENITIIGGYTLGGINGGGSGVQYTDSTNVTVSGYAAVGGLVGYSSYASYSTLSDSTITADKIAGGLAGIVYSASYSTAANLTVTAGSYAGGITGAQATFTPATEVLSIYGASSISNASVIDCYVEATEGTHAGGIIGYMYTDGDALTKNVVTDTVIVSAKGYAGGIAGEQVTSDIVNCYVTGGSVTSLSGPYTGGVVGRWDYTLTYSGTVYTGEVYKTYSDTEVSGDSYVGGVFGYYQITSHSNSSTSLYLYSNINYSDVKGNSEVYALGYIDSQDSLDYLNETYYGINGSYEDVLINGQTISSVSQVTNISDSTHFQLLSFDTLTSYSTATATVANGGLYLSVADYTYNLANTGNLASFDIIVKDIVYSSETTETTYSFEFHNIQLADGTYYVSLASSNGGTSYHSGATKLEITVANGSATLTYEISSSTVSRNFYVRIFDDDGNVYAAEYFYGTSTAYTYVPLYVDGVESNYKYSTTNEEITLAIAEEGDYVWYVIYTGQGYSASKTVVTVYSDGNSLTTDLPGIYYAVDEDADIRTQMFVYETNLYLPVLSNSYVVRDYQNGYAYTSDGLISSLYEGNLSLGGTALGMISRTAMLISSATVNATLPEYDVYSSGVDTINIEFDTSVPYVDSSETYTVTLSSGGITKTYTVTGRVMSFTYDFSSDLTVTISSSVGQNSTTYQASELQSLVSVYGDHYYYLSTNGVTDSDGETIEGDFVNIFDYYALDSDGYTYDLTAQTKGSSKVSALSSVNVVPLYESTYTDTTDSSISSGDVLYTYSTFTYNVTSGNEIEDTVIFVKDGTCYGFTGTTYDDPLGYITDYYNGTSYVGYVNSSGYLVDASNTLKIPDGFKTYNIVEISDTFDGNKHIVLVRYLYGQIKAFDYVTGEEIELLETTSISLLDYVTSAISSFMMGDTTAYGNADSLDNATIVAATIEEMSDEELDEFMDSTDAPLDSSYNSTQTTLIFSKDVLAYETYFVAELFYSNEEEVTSVQEKIEVATEAGYQGTLNNLVVTTTYVSEAKDNTVNIVIFAALSVSVGGLLVYLKRSNKEKDII